jgi:NADPH-dependent 2,4-dienoyl-CoA reductase/sulfur reductase-like enzyme/nitrite reductase/ring-hydroxylating ferredoxin subunit
MGSANTELTGPDLAEGVELSKLEEGKPLLGHARGEALVLVRSGDEVFATGATCTHYSGPLAEGLVAGRTLRCPWHHACFSLETGEAIGAPALSPVPCYAVVRDGARVRVGEKREAPKRSLDLASLPASIAVVGAGAAGAAAVEALRREGYRGPIMLIGDEEPGPVDRPNLSKDYLAGTAPEEWIPLRSADFYRELGVELVLGDPVTSLDATARSLTLKSGKALSFGAILLATGARPRKLDVPGADSSHVYLLRTLADSRAIIAGLDGKKNAVVIGASFIGLEVAAALRHRGLEVEVVAPDAVPLARILGDEVGRFVQKLHEEHGVRFHLGRKPAKISPNGVTLDDGTELASSLVVAGVGVTPRTELAEAAGLDVNGGIVVDAALRTSAAGIFAAGDVARYPDPITGQPARVEHWVHAERQGQAAARSLLGKGRPFSDAPFFWSQHYDLTLAYVGHAPAWDRIETRGELAKSDFAAAYVKGGRVVAVLTVGRDKESLLAEATFESGGDVDLRKLFEGS